MIVTHHGFICRVSVSGRLWKLIIRSRFACINLCVSVVHVAVHIVVCVLHPYAYDHRPSVYIWHYGS